MANRYVTPAAVYAREALRRGPLTRVCLFQRSAGPLYGYRFGRRLFRPQTVNSLITAGEAVRDNDTVRRA